MYRRNRRLDVGAPYEFQGNVPLTCLERQSSSKDACVEDVVTQRLLLHLVLNQSKRAVSGSEVTQAKLYEGQIPIGVRTCKLKVKRIDLFPR